MSAAKHLVAGTEAAARGLSAENRIRRSAGSAALCAQRQIVAKAVCRPIGAISSSTNAMTAKALPRKA
ncbi:hypothetical protein [Lysobacter antibioticus]|uniref:hypothetical protein n=1 Tax=Lysobacter antibioticus TaxID=84531 RepID=UPI0011E00228|nr:hypothetical protein [Lysobacter antibioticus]